MADTALPSLSDESQKYRSRSMGIALMCATLICFSGTDALAKWVNQSMDPMVTVWARYVSGAFLTVLVINPRTKPGVLRSKKLPLQLLRSCLLFSTTICNFIALKYLQLVETTSITFSTPLIVALLAGPFLGEWVGMRRLIAIGVGFIGILVITRPGMGTMHPVVLLCIASAFCYAFYVILTRMLASTDSTATTTIYSSVAGVVLMTPVMPFFWTTPPTLSTWIGLLSVGAIASFGHWLLVMAHARAPAAILAPFIYTQIVWMLALGYIIFGDWPDLWTFVGAGIVIASGLYLLSRERAKKAT
jgi:drug/metabolite transporter (DMT)-like permease